MLLYVVEAADELLVGVLQGVVGVDFVESGSVDKAEEHVAKLLLGLLLVHLLHLGLELANLFLHLLPHLTALLPVEAYVAGLVLYAVGLDERGEGSGYAAEYGLVASFLLELQLLPVFHHLCGCFGLGFAEDVWVAEDELLAEAVADVLDVEVARFAANFGIESHVEQHVAQLLADVALVAPQQGIA